MHYFQKILKDLNIKHTVPYARHLFESRMDANSLYGIKKMLETFGLTITAFKVSDTESIEYPCIAQYEGFIKVFKSPPENPRELIERPILIVSDRGRAREPQYLKHLLRIVIQLTLPYIAGAALVFLATVTLIPSQGWANFDWHRLALLVLNAIGVYFSWRTVAKECSGSCHDVLESPASKVLDVYSLGVIGLSYFIGSFLIALAFPQLLPLFALISCAALIMPLWSISYQAFIVKSWCKNCLTVQGVLIATFLAELLFNKIDISNMKWDTAISALSLYVIIFFISDKVYALAQREKEYPKDLVAGYNTIMREESVKDIVINRGDYYDTEGASTLVIYDDPEAKRELILVISPFCVYCKKLFTTTYELMEADRFKGFKVRILFPPEPAALPVYGAAISEYQTHGSEALLKFLGGWYKSTNIGKMRKIYADCKETEMLKEEILRQKKWFEKSGFKGSPALLVNGHFVSYTLLNGLTI